MLFHPYFCSLKPLILWIIISGFKLIRTTEMNMVLTPLISIKYNILTFRLWIQYDDASNTRQTQKLKKLKENQYLRVKKQSNTHRRHQQRVCDDKSWHRCLCVVKEIKSQKWPVFIYCVITCMAGCFFAIFFYTIRKKNKLSIHGLFLFLHLGEAPLMSLSMTSQEPSSFPRAGFQDPTTPAWSCRLEHSLGSQHQRFQTQNQDQEFRPHHPHPVLHAASQLPCQP